MAMPPGMRKCVHFKRSVDPTKLSSLPIHGMWVLRGCWHIWASRPWPQPAWAMLYRSDKGITIVDSGRALEHMSLLTPATNLPVSADLSKWLRGCYENYRRKHTTSNRYWSCGGSIEDATGQPGRPIYGCEEPAERIRSAAEGARALPFRSFLLHVQKTIYMAVTIFERRSYVSRLIKRRGRC